MMAEDIRQALLAVESIHAVTICLGDHFAAPAIETGVNAGTPFAEAFAAEGGGNLDTLREIAIIIGLVSGSSGFLIEPGRDNEHLLGILPGCTECLRPLMRILDDIDHIA
jgi:hypothetical protein